MSLLAQYLFFLSRRPISQSNLHYLDARLRGLQSLRDPLLAAGVPRLERVVRRLEALHPAAFQRLAYNLQVDLMPLAEATTELPADLVVCHQAPEAAALGACRRVLLVMGPGIGIGDEIIFFPVPSWLKAAYPDMEVTVLSAYDALWGQVRQVDHTLSYRDHRQLLAALRGEAPYCGFDLVVLGEFERPGIAAAMATDRRTPRYLEVSLGQRTADLVDNTTRFLYRLDRPEVYRENFYLGLDQICRWLGLAPSPEERFSVLLDRTDAVAKEEAEGPVRVFVSPFTSKYNPSRSYWSELLAALAAGAPERGALFLLDTGKGLATERFAAAVMRSAQARAGSRARFERARLPGKDGLSLADALAVMGSSQLVVCADSWTGHAAPLLGCTTLVIAQRDLDGWRVPHPASYHFHAEDPVEEVAASMGQVLHHWGFTAASEVPAMEGGARRLHTLTERLDEGFAQGEADAILAPLYDEFLPAYRGFVDHLDRWPTAYRRLLADTDYRREMRSFESNGRAAAASANGTREALLTHLHDQIERWQNTNLRKYLRLCLAGSPDGSPSAPGDGA